MTAGEAIAHAHRERHDACVQEIGPYLIQGQVARGGMGVVLRALDRRLNRPVALKLLTATSPDELARRRFVREVQALARLDHPHVVRVLDAGEHQGLLYLAMELVDGEALATRIERLGPLEPRAAAELGVQLARALGYAHGEGLVHRDVKPSNVLLQRAGGAKLVDFGLVRDMDPERSHLSRTGVYLGTPGYWPPEQALGQVARIGPASDVYGLGATLYAALSGRPPFVFDDIASYVHAAEQAAPLPLRRLRPELDPTLERVLMRCLERDPARRHPTAGALGDELEAWLAGERDPAPRRRAALLLGLGLIGLGGATAVVLVTLGRSHTPAETAPSVPAPAAPTASREVELARAEELLDLDPRGAEETAAELLARSPLDARARRLRGLALVGLGRRAEALPELESALAAGQDDPPLRAALALARLAARDPRGALAEAEAALLHAPQLVLAHHARGEALLALGELARAEEAADRAVARRRDRTAAPGLNAAGAANGLAAALALRAHVRHLRGNQAGALADLDQALTLAPRRADWLEQRASLHLAAGRAAPGLSDLERALAVEPTSTRALCLQAVALLRLGRREEALRSAERAVESDRYAGPAYLARADALRELGRARESEADLDHALALDPTLHEALGKRAELRRLRGAAEEALDDLTRALALEPDSVRLLARRAELLLARGDAERALEDANLALQRAPGDREVLLSAARVRLGRGELELARTMIDLVLAQDPDSRAGLVLRAGVHVRRGELARARADLDRVLERDPHDLEARVDRASVLRGLGEDAASLADLEQVLARAPGHGRAHLERGLTRLALKELEGAAEDARIALEERPRDASAHFLAGELAATRGAWPAALASFDRALVLAPDHPDVLFSRAQVRARQQDMDGWRRDVDRVLELAPDHAQARYLRGRDVLDSDGDPALALTHLERACAGAAPRDARPVFYRGVAKQRLERTAEALADFDRALELDPDWIDARLQRCVVRLELEDHPGMALDAARVIELDPEVADAWLYRGLARLMLGEDLAGAAADAERCLEVAARQPKTNPTTPELAKVVLARARERLAQPQEGR